jgi:hypothetical protein
MTNRKIIGVKESVAFKNFYSVLYPSQWEQVIKSLLNSCAGFVPRW